MSFGATLSGGPKLIDGVSSQNDDPRQLSTWRSSYDHAVVDHRLGIHRNEDVILIERSDTFWLLGVLGEPPHLFEVPDLVV